MKVIIAGSQTINNYDLLCEVIKESRFEITEVVSGQAKGVDTMGERWAKEHNIPVKPFPADWKRYKKAAGKVRNGEMARYGEALILLWTGQSPGSRNMLMQAKERKLKIYECNTMLIKDYIIREYMLLKLAR